MVYKNTFITKITVQYNNVLIEFYSKKAPAWLQVVNDNEVRDIIDNMGFPS